MPKSLAMFTGSRVLPTQPYLEANSHVTSDVRDAFAVRTGRNSNYCTYSSTSRSVSNILMQKGTSEALPVDDGGARLVVLALRDPHLLEGAQRGQDRTAD